MKKVGFVSLGCPKNLTDTETMLGLMANKYAIVTNPEEAEIIRKVFNDYINGKGFLTIARTLNTLGITTHKGNKIETRTIEYWLNNPLYIGKSKILQIKDIKKIK